MIVIPIPATHFLYMPPETRDDAAFQLVVEDQSEFPRRCVFYDRIELGRYHETRKMRPGLLLIQDPTVSKRHCIISITPEGTCLIRDVSRNGTRVDGRRLVPHQEFELHPGQVICVGNHLEFRLEGDEAAPAIGIDPSLLLDEEPTEVSVLVGDIRNYTELVQEVFFGVTQSVVRVFEAIEAAVGTRGGTVKEYQGDSVLAFWEASNYPDHAVRACRTALELDALVTALAQDRAIWDVDEFPLHLDWAISTGQVLLQGSGGAYTGGLVMVGEPIVKAYRMEKLATQATGPIVACSRIRALAGTSFDFADLGQHELKGFKDPEQVFGLRGPAPDESTPNSIEERP